MAQPVLKRCTVAHLDVVLPAGDGDLGATLTLPVRPQGLVIHALRSAGARAGESARRLGRAFAHHRLAVLAIDLLTSEEEWIDDVHPGRRFGRAQLAARLIAATRWATTASLTADLPLGYLASGSAAAIALRAAAELDPLVGSVVARAPRLLDGPAPSVRAATLVLTGGDATHPCDGSSVLAAVTGPTRVVTLGLPAWDALDLVGEHATAWMIQHLTEGFPKNANADARTRALDA